MIGVINNFSTCIRFLAVILITLQVSCSQPSSGPTREHQQQDPGIMDSLEDRLVVSTIPDYDTAQWKEISVASGILLDLRYATDDNFTGQQIYDCGRCFLRPGIADKLIRLNTGIMERYGLRFKLFDCYRPGPAQKKLWDIFPDPSYVTPPQKGSMHNKGMAVDLTLADMKGGDLDMGTEFDHFGMEAHMDNLNLGDRILSNRKLLQTMMEEIGFKGIRTEWWHYSYQMETYDSSEWEWSCPE